MAVETPAVAQPIRTGSGLLRHWAQRVAAYRFSQPVAIYLAAHLVLMALVWVMLSLGHFQFIQSLETGGDANWYRQVALYGYERQLEYYSPGVPAEMRLEFFPLLPLLMRLGSDLTTLNVSLVGLVISAVSSVVAAAGIYTVVSRYTSHAVALATVGLWATMPTAFFQSMVYTEALFTALAAWTLYALLEARWLSAAALTAAAGALRPDSLPLIAVVCLACGVGAFRGRGRPWNGLLGMVIAPVGLAGYLLYIGLRVHNLRAWFISVQAPGWQNSFDFGKYTYRTLLWIIEMGSRENGEGITYTIVGVLVAVSIAAACIVALDRRVPLELKAWTWIGLLFILGQANMWFAMPRFLMPCFPLLVPVAEAFTAMTRRNKIILGTTAVLLSACWGAYFLAYPFIGI
jgi:hypothetical protein